jgi:hypothetical protein
VEIGDEKGPHGLLTQPRGERHPAASPLLVAPAPAPDARDYSRYSVAVFSPRILRALHLGPERQALLA